MTPEQRKRIEVVINKLWASGNFADAEALRAALAEVARLREVRDRAYHAAQLAYRDEARELRAGRANPTCTRVCQVPCCGQTIIDRTPSGQIPCGDY
jgi:hypothetical protein